MASMLQDVFNSIFEPGVNDGLVKAMNLSFYALFAVLAGMCALTNNIHVYALLALSVGLFASLRWFIAELKAVQQTQPAPTDSSTKSTEASTEATLAKQQPLDTDKSK